VGYSAFANFLDCERNSEARLAPLPEQSLHRALVQFPGPERGVGGPAGGGSQHDQWNDSHVATMRQQDRNRKGRTGRNRV
jgi:hypothetical protein